MFSTFARRGISVCLWFLLWVVSPPAQAQVSYKGAKGIFMAKSQDYCFDGPYKAKSKDKWLALVRVGSKWELQEAVVNAGVVKARSGIAKFFIKPQGQLLVPGSVVAADIVRLKGKNALVSESKFSFANKIWHWVEWGDFAFYLQQGDIRWSVEDSSWPWENVVMVPGRVSVPVDIRSSSQQYRDDYDVGSTVLLWAGDLNGDGLLDIITHRQVKEAWGTMLWSSHVDESGLVKLKLIAWELDGCS